MEFILDDTLSEKIESMAKWLTDSSLKPSLLLYGGLGNGKTTMVKAVRDTIKAVKDNAKDYDAKYSPRFHGMLDTANRIEAISKMPELAIETAQGVAHYASADKEYFETRLKRRAFLAIDDLGCEPSTVKNYGTEITPVTDIIYARYDSMLPTIITTNLDKKDIRERYGDRVADRFNEMFESLAFINKSYRK